MPPPTAKTPLPFGKYLLVEKLASGGMAEVFRAVLRGSAGFEKPVALKRILPVFGEEPDFVTLFQDEARIVSTLSHANIAQVFDFGEVDGVYYLAMELVDGLDLAKLGARMKAVGQPMPLATACFIVAEAARGLAYAHAQHGPDGNRAGIVHRDVSPANLLISRAGEVKLADFGIAKAAGKVHKTETGVVMGKLRYMSPEQVEAGTLDARSDIFSLGVVLYEMLAGGPIFPDEPGARLAERIRNAEIPPPSTRNPAVPQALDAIVLHALARAPEDRYPDAAGLARDLSVFVSSTAPDFTREDLGALVRGLAPASAPPPVDAGAPTADLRAPEVVRTRRRRVSGAGWMAIVLSLVILGSGALVVFRVVMPGRDTEVPDAARLVVAPAIDAGVHEPEPPPTAPFTLLPTATPEERARLDKTVDDFPVSRRGVPGPEYAAFLTGLDTALATLVIGPDGTPLAPEEPPPLVAAVMGRAGVAPAVNATMEYVRRTGALPPLVRSALVGLLASMPAASAVDLVVDRKLMPPFSAAALAVWLEPRSKRRLVELAYANDVLGRWCQAPAAPDRAFAPVLCEPAALVAALRAIDPRDPTAAALERAAGAGLEVQGPAGPIAIETAQYLPTSRPDALQLSVGLSAEAAGVTLLMGGAPDTPLSPVPDAPLTFTAVVPQRIVAPVLRVEGASGLIRLPAPPFGGP